MPFQPRQQSPNQCDTTSAVKAQPNGVRMEFRVGGTAGINMLGRGVISTSPDAPIAKNMIICHCVRGVAGS